MDWVLNRELDSFGEDINIYAKGLKRPNKCPDYRTKGLPKKYHLKLVVDNTKKDKKK